MARRKSYRRKKRRLNANAGALLVFIVVLCVAAVLGTKIRSLSATREAYAAQEEQLSQEYEEEQNRSESLEESKDYVQSKDYVEKIAREKLGLVGEDETIVKPGN